MFMDAKSVVMVDILDGFRASIMKQVTPFFAITHEYDASSLSYNSLG